VQPSKGIKSKNHTLQPSTMLPTKIKDLIPALSLIPHPEGGFFVETWRSGCEPMTTMGQTGLDETQCQDPQVNLVVAQGRAQNRPDKDERRNALTSIYWVPTVKSPTLFCAKNHSDHIHYYQGGKPFRYYLYDPKTATLSTVVLGPELHKGQKLQVGVKGGIWKCGRIEEEGTTAAEDDNGYEYTIIGEAVAPGFDFHDFNWITKEMIQQECKDDAVKEQLLEFVNSESTKIEEEQKTVEAAGEFYEEGDQKKQRETERA